MQVNLLSCTLVDRVTAGAKKHGTAQAHRVQTFDFVKVNEVDNTAQNTRPEML